MAKNILFKPGILEEGLLSMVEIILVIISFRSNVVMDKNISFYTTKFEFEKRYCRIQLWVIHRGQIALGFRKYYFKPATSFLIFLLCYQCYCSISKHLHNKSNVPKPKVDLAF